MGLMTFIEKGTPCLGCSGPIKQHAVVVDTVDGQQVWHWSCLPQDVKEQVMAFQGVIVGRGERTALKTFRGMPYRCEETVEVDGGHQACDALRDSISCPMGRAHIDG